MRNYAAFQFVCMKSRSEQYKHEVNPVPSGSNILLFKIVVSAKPGTGLESRNVPPLRVYF
jgi:hypothetical protein